MPKPPEPSTDWIENAPTWAPDGNGAELPSSAVPPPLIRASFITGFPVFHEKSQELYLRPVVGCSLIFYLLSKYTCLARQPPQYPDPRK